MSTGCFDLNGHHWQFLPLASIKRRISGGSEAGKLWWGRSSHDRGPGLQTGNQATTWLIVPGLSSEEWRAVLATDYYCYHYQCSEGRSAYSRWYVVASGYIVSGLSCSPDYISNLTSVSGSLQACSQASLSKNISIHYQQDTCLFQQDWQVPQYCLHRLQLTNNSVFCLI